MMKTSSSLKAPLNKRWEPFLLYLVVVAVGITSMIWRFDYLQAQKLEIDFLAQAHQIESTLIETTIYTESVLRYVASEVVQNNNIHNLNNIYKIFGIFKNDNKFKDTLSLSGIQWTNKKHQLVLSANLNILKTPVDISSRDYIPLTVDKPDKLHMGRAIIGGASKKWVFPAGFGVDDKNGQYAGAFTMGFDISKFADMLKQKLIMQGTEAELIDASLKPVLIIDGKSSVIPNNAMEKWLGNIDFTRNINSVYQNTSFLRLGNNYYMYKLQDQPYVIFLSHYKYLSLNDITKIIWENASEFILIIFCIISIIYFIQRTNIAKPSLSREYFVFVAVITSLATIILIWLLVSFYTYQNDDKKYRYSIDAEKIVDGLDEQFSYVENLAQFIGGKISALDKYDAASISKLLGSGNNVNPQRQEIFSWSLFDFIDANGNVIASGSQGVLPVLRPVTNRSYMQDAPKRPWKLHLSEPAIGITSGEFVIPAGFAITAKDSDKFIGILSMGFNITRLVRKLENLLTSESTNFVILNRKNGLAVLQSSGNLQEIDRTFFTGKLDYIQNTEADNGILPKDIEYHDISYRYFRNMYNYPYTILIGESRNYLNQEFRIEMLPKFIEFGGVWLFILIVLFFFRLKIVAPLISLSNAAKAISEGNTNIKIPHIRSIETSHLANSILQVKRAFINEAKLKEQLKQAKEASEAASKSKTDFLSSTAHELRSPLNAIIGMSEVIKTKLFGDKADSYVEYAGDIESSGYELLDFISDLIDISKTESGGFALDYEEPVDIANIINRTKKLNINAANKVNINIDIHFADDLPKLFADGRRLRQALVNLVSNSIKYSPPDTTITVSAIMRDGKIVLVVADQGFGMNEEQLATAMTKWGKVANENSGKVYSSGLGLPLAKYLIELHGAEFLIESVPGKGTTITMVFPEVRIAK